jgi:hypothetical protein
MLKLYLGEVAGASFGNLEADALMNWQHYDLARIKALARDGADVWPMLRRADAKDNRHLIRLQAYRDVLGKEPSHVMVLNEPFNLGQDGFTDPQLAAEWAAKTISEAQLAPTTTIIMGGFDLTYAPLRVGTYAAIRDKVLTFAQALGDPGLPIVWALHLYLNEVPSNLDSALRWYGAQLHAIAQDFPHFAITETGVLSAGYSGRERDIATLRQLLVNTWGLADECGCYAYGWYLATGNRLTGLPDYVLCDQAGNLRLLGPAYRDLTSSTTPPLPTTTEPDAVALIEGLFADAAWLRGYNQDHPDATNAELMVQLRDVLKPYKEAIEK